MPENTGNRYAICIGIGDYMNDDITDLKYTRNDAKKLTEVLYLNGQFDQVFVMTDDRDPKNKYFPNKKNIKSLLDELNNEIEANDLVLFFFSGHGVSNPKNENFLVLPETYPENLYETSLKLDYIVTWLQELQVKKSLLLIDACRSRFQKNKAINLKGLKATQYTRAEVAAAFYSTRSGWFSFEDSESKLGAFTRFIIDGLKGGADQDKQSGNGDFIVTFIELASYVEDKVFKWALENDKSQRPSTKIYGERFGNLALSTYININDKRKRESEQWLRNFQAKVQQLEKKDQDTHLLPESKLKAWQDLRSKYSANNPYSDDDKELRGKVSQKVKYWEDYIEKKGPSTVTLRSIPKELTENDVNNMFQDKNFYESLRNRFGEFKNKYQSKSINGHWIIIDESTGLMWAWGGSNAMGTHANAIDWLKEVNRHVFAGFSDWRLPTLEEAATLLESKKMSGGLFLDSVFSNFQQWIWTSDPDGSGKYWTVCFLYGNVMAYPENYGSWARPVRSMK